MFASVAKYTTVRMILAFAAQEQLEMVLLDVKAEFLNGKLDEKIFMEQPEGDIVKGKENFVYELLKAPYGLKQASSACRKVINSFLLSIGCVQSMADSSLYVLIIDGETVYIVVYVDDILMLAHIMKVLRQVPDMTTRNFEVRIEKKVTKFLGMVIEQDSVSRTVKMHSCTMIDQMMEKFDMMNSLPAKTPLPEGVFLSITMAPVDEGDKYQMERTPSLVNNFLVLGPNADCFVQVSVQGPE